VVPWSPPGRPLKWDSSMLMAPLLRLDEKVGRTLGLRNQAVSEMEWCFYGVREGRAGGREIVKYAGGLGANGAELELFWEVLIVSPLQG